ncbi:ABC transporter substrate-binding protein [Candidatus Bipolaricaulota bacterium]|nr:ABC transporter substrate-binding protein [Candidatus Bipolaricaulota bacterium]
MKRFSSLLLITILLGLAVVNFGYAEATRTVTDSLDRQVSLSGNPERVVTTIPSTTEIALDLGLDERLVGVSDLTKYLSYVPKLQAKADKTEKVGKFKLSMEKIAALNPDLIIVDGVAQKDVVSKLEDLDTTVYAVGGKDIDEVSEAILELGYLTGTKDRAQEIVGQMAYKKFQLRGAVRELEEKKTTLYTLSERMYTVGENTLVGQVLELAGLDNVFSDLSGYKPVSTEKIIQRNPELIIATEISGLSVESLKNEVGLKGVKAIKEENILLLSRDEDSMINQRGTKIVDGAINLFERVYDKEVNL